MNTIANDLGESLANLVDKASENCTLEIGKDYILSSGGILLWLHKLRHHRMHDTRVRFILRWKDDLAVQALNRDVLD